LKSIPFGRVGCALQPTLGEKKQWHELKMTFIIEEAIEFLCEDSGLLF